MNTKYISIFLSHSSKDKKIVRKIFDALNKSDFDIWIDEMKIIPGEMIIEKVESGIEMAQLLLLFISENSNNSSWVDYEWKSYIDQKLRNNQKVYLIPIILGGSEITPSLKKFKYINFDNKKESIKEIVESVNRLIISDAEERRGYQSIESKQIDRIINKNTSTHTQEITIKILKNFHSFEFLFWQDKVGKIEIIRTISNDAVTGEVIAHECIIEEHNQSHLKLRMLLKSINKGQIVKFLFEIRTKNYFHNLMKIGSGYTEFSIRHPISFFSYRFMYPKSKQFNSINAKVTHRQGSSLKIEDLGGEIQYYYQTNELATNERLRFDFLDSAKIGDSTQ